MAGAEIERHSTGGPDVAAQRGHTLVFEIDERVLFEPGGQGDPSPGEPGQLQGCGRVPGLRSAGG